MSKLDTLEPDFKAKIETFLARLTESGFDVAITACRRTMAEQNQLYAKGRTTPGDIVTNARGGSSPHNFGLAVDICPIKHGELWWNAPDDVWHAMAEIGKQCGLVPGYYFTSIHDAPHYEDPAWKETQAAWKRGEIQVA